MNFAPGAIILDDIIGGTLQVGEVPNARLETDLTSLADALTVGGIVPHANLTEYLATLAPALTAAGIVPNANLTPRLRDFTNALTAGSKVPHANLTGELVTLATALMAGGKVPHANLTDYLAQLAASLAGGGNVPWDKIMRVDGSSYNGGAIVLPTGGIAITQVNCGNVYTNERFIVSGMAITSKGPPNPGSIGIDVRKESGTAVINFFHSYHQVAQIAPDVWVGEPAYLNCCGTGEVTTGGTLTFGLHGFSKNGDSTVGIGGGQLAVWILAQS